MSHLKFCSREGNYQFIRRLVNTSLNGGMPPAKGKNDKEDKAERVEDDNTSDSKCGSCMKMVTAQESGVLCEICGIWFHCR